MSNLKVQTRFNSTLQFATSKTPPSQTGNSPVSNTPAAVLIQNLLTGTASGTSSSAKGVAISKPESIDNIYDLERAIENGQIEEITICDLNAVANFQNNKSHYEVKFKTSKETGNKKGHFEIGEFVSPNQIENLQRTCVNKQVKFKANRIDPNVEGAKQVGLVVLPAIATGVIWLGSMMGIKVYNKHQFKKLVKEKLITNSSQLGISEDFKIGLKDLKNKLPGYNGEIRDYLEQMHDSLEQLSKLPPEQITPELVNALSLTLTGWAGTGKTSLQQLIDWNLIEKFSSTNTKIGILNLKEIYKGTGKAEGSSTISLPSFFGLSKAEEADIIYEVCKDLNMVRLRMDDGNHGSQARSLNEMTELNKALYDRIQDSLEGKVAQPRGLMGKATHAIKGFFRNKEETNKSKLRGVCVGVSSNATLSNVSSDPLGLITNKLNQINQNSTSQGSETTAEFAAILRRFGKIINIDSMAISDRYDLIRNLIAKKYTKSPAMDINNVALFLTQLTKPESSEIESLPVSSLIGIVQFLKADPGNPNSLSAFHTQLLNNRSQEHRGLINSIKSAFSSETYTEEAKAGLDELTASSDISQTLQTLQTQIQADRSLQTP